MGDHKKEDKLKKCEKKEREKDSSNFGVGLVSEKSEKKQKKKEKKKKKKKRDDGVGEDSEVANEEIFVESENVMDVEKSGPESELESAKSSDFGSGEKTPEDAKKKKKKKEKEKSSKFGVTSSSDTSASESLGDLGHGEDSKRKRRRKDDNFEYENNETKKIEQELSTKSQDTARIVVDRAHAMSNGSVHVNKNGRKKTGEAGSAHHTMEKELESEKSTGFHFAEETTEDVKKKEGKGKSSKYVASSSLDTTGSDSLGDSGHKGNNKRKRRMENDSFEHENNITKKVKREVSTVSPDTAQVVEKAASVSYVSVNKNSDKRKKNGEAANRKNSITKTKKAVNVKVDKKAPNLRKQENPMDFKTPESQKKARRVSFSGEVEVFPPENMTNCGEDGITKLVQGKRFSKEEDELVKKAVLQYIETNQLGEEGVHMLMHCSKYPKLRNCWKEIGESLPWRPYVAVYYRAHVLFERSEKRTWEPEEYEIIKRHVMEHGHKWAVLAETLGKHRIHVKDTWRRIRLSTKRRGRWSQDEYQALFDLVNLDLQLKAHEEKKSKHGMLRDNISWEVISQKLTTRSFATCCEKWYSQLTSNLVSEGLWADSDDYRLLDALQNLDASCVEDVDWDNLLEHRSGEICQKRWKQMTQHIGGYKEKSFIEQVELLSKRYCPEMLEYRR